MVVETIADYGSETAEGPLWDERRQRVFWIDIYDGQLFEYDPETDDHDVVWEGGVLGGTTLQNDGSLLLFGEAGAVFRLQEGKTSAVIDEMSADAHTRYNDCIADPEGRVYCGTKGTETGPGRLYRLDTDGTIHLVEDELGLSNGLGFSPDGSTLYHTDSTADRIYAYDYAASNGALSNRRTFVDLSSEPGMPDGLTVDADGCVWSAQYGGGCLLRYAADGDAVDRVQLPVENVTSLAFGGPSLQDLYVTTAKRAEGPSEPNAGALFRVSTDVIGRLPFRSNI